MTSKTTRATKSADPSPEAAARVLRQFRLVFNSVKTHFQQVERKVGLGGAQVWALHVIHSNPGIGVNGLAAAMDVRQPTASNLVRALVALGMVEVRKDGPDRRAVQLHLLKPGAVVLRRAPGPYAGVLPEALSALDAHTLARLEADLGELIQVLGADERGAGIPLAQM
jgi:DNA-binding MarR family transcriptional regulator